MKKIFILDTNVILADPMAIYQFEDNDVYIPISVIEELDNFKKGLNDLARNARHFSRILDDLRSQGSLSTGAKISSAKNSGKLFVVLESDISLLPANCERKPDNLILSVALILKYRFPKIPVILITKDSNMRIKGDAAGITTQDYEHTKVDIDDLYTGIAEFDVEENHIQEFLTSGKLKMNQKSLDILPNQYAILRSKKDINQFVYGKYNNLTGYVEALTTLGKKDNIWGIYPRNLEQSFALDLLLDDSVKLVTLVGNAGTGKTLLAIAAGLEKVTEQCKYKKLLVSRPIFPLGKDIGFLPGSMEEKLNPWMQPVFDNLELLLTNKGPTSNPKKKSIYGGNERKSEPYKELMEQGILQVEPITYIRGRSIPMQYFIVDEAQNLTPHEIKTILTRAGDNTKIILTGDPNQIDNPYIDAASNGLTYVIEKFKKEAIAGHITLTKGERSELATLASTLL